MGLDDLIDKAKGLLGGGAGDAEKAAGDAVDEAGEAQGAAAGLIDKAKSLATDERIDQVADAIQAKTPDEVDRIVETVAEKAKGLN